MVGSGQRYEFRRLYDEMREEGMGIDAEFPFETGSGLIQMLASFWGPYNRAPGVQVRCAGEKEA